MRHTVVLNTPPRHTPTDYTPDGAVAGNGDLAVVLGGTPGLLRFWIGKSDFWQFRNGRDGTGIARTAVFQIQTPNFDDAAWHVEQDMDRGELRGSFRSDDRSVTFRCIVCAVENTILWECSGCAPYAVSLEIPPSDDGCVHRHQKNGMLFGERRFAAPELTASSITAFVLKRLPDETRSGERIRRFALFCGTNHESPCFREMTAARAEAFDTGSWQSAWTQHEAWWRTFYDRSAVAVADPELEMNWYAGQYLLACCARNRSFPPGLWGNFITTDTPGWKGDYHLNYNYQASFYAACSSNHVELTDGYSAPLRDFMPYGHCFAQKFEHCRGIYFPVGIGPRGLDTTANWFSEEHGEYFLGQKSNALHGATVMIFRWRATHDREYALTELYPYLKEALAFFEDYLKFEDGFCQCRNDAAHEVKFWEQAFRNQNEPVHENDRNNILTAGLLRMALKTALELAAELGLDEERRPVWRHILEHLPPFPVLERNGEHVFRLTEEGEAYNPGNAVMLQHIYPCGCIGLGSEADLLRIARATFAMDDRWEDGNAFPTYAPCAARLGIAPEEILAGLRRVIHHHQYPNMMFNRPGGGVENNAVVANTMNEMMMQSHEGVLRLFPVWPVHLDAAFRNLRADGAFLVSAEWRGGAMQSCRILSERGGILTLDVRHLAQHEILYRGRRLTPGGEAELKLAMEPGERMAVEKTGTPDR